MSGSGLGTLAGGAGLTGGLGMKSGPVWPHPATSSPDKTTAAMPVLREKGDITIRIKV